MLQSDGVIKKDEHGNFIFEATRVTNWPIKKIVDKLGPRVPNHEDSQRSFRLAVIAVSNDNYPLEEYDIMYLSRAIELFVKDESIRDHDTITFELVGDTHKYSFDSGLYNFWDATGGRARISAEIASARKAVD